MRVALLSFDFGELSIRLANALSDDVDVLLLLPHQQAAPHLARLAPSVGFQPFHRPRFRQPIQQLAMVRSILESIRDFNPDVLHLQQGHMWFNLALPLLRRYPLVLTIHDPKHHMGDRDSRKTPQWIMDFGFQRADQLIVHGVQLQQEVTERLSASSERVHVIPHISFGVDTTVASGREEGSLILFFGRIWEYKGLEYLIRAEPLITAEVPEARIVIAGRGEAFDRYRRMMVHPDRFIVHNEFVSDEKRAKLFMRSSVVVLPYVDASQSGVIPLAYAFRKPVVATRVGALAEMVDEGETGFLVPPREGRALAEAVVRLLRDSDLRRRLGENGKRKLDAECSPGVVARKTLEVYRKALTGEPCGVTGVASW